MGKLKLFITGFVLGGMLTGGAVWASDGSLIEVKFPDITYWLDGERLDLSTEEYPTTIHYKDLNYVPARKFAAALNKEVRWNQEKGEVQLVSAEELQFETVSREYLTPELKDWVERSLTRETTQTRIVGDDTYVLITLGKKNTGGFGVAVTSVHKLAGDLQVRYETRMPLKDDFVTEEVTFPHTLIKLSGKRYDAVRFIPLNGEPLADLVGLRYLPPIRQETSNIMLLEPAVHEDRLVLKGVVRTFEGVIVYTLLDGEGQVLERSSLLAEAGAPHWGYFEQSLLLPDDASDLTVSFHTVSPQDGSEDESLRLSLGEWSP